MSKLTLKIFLLSFVSLLSIAQEKKLIEIKKAGSFQLNEKEYPGANILIKDIKEQVHLFHDGMDIWSDKTLFYKSENSFKAYGNVRVQQGDSIRLTANYVEYNGTTRFAKSKGNVVLTNLEMTLITDTLYLDRNKQEAYYNTLGIVTDETTTITSNEGTYYLDLKKYRFVSEVKIKNDDMTINSTQLDFFTENKHAYFYGPTTIVGEDYDIFCKRGFYDTTFKKGYFKDNAEIDYDLRNITGDSIYFDDQRQYAAATQNIIMTDTLNKTLLMGDYAEVFKALDSAMITRRALAVNLIEGDSLYVHADTLVSTGPADARMMKGYYNVRIFKSDLSGKSDSIHINQQTGLTKLLRRPLSDKEIQFLTPQEISFKNPVLWSSGSQMTGDVIHLINDPENEVLDSLKIIHNAFLIEKDSLGIDNYNQIKGIRLLGDFVNNKLKTVDVIQNTEMIYYLYDDDTKELVGIDRAICSSLRLDVEENQIKKVTFFTNPDGVVYPEKDMPINARKLSGFRWRGDEIIRSKNDLFKDQPQKKK